MKPRVRDEDPPIVSRAAITNSIGMKLVRITRARSRWARRREQGRSNEEPQHEVEITKAFYMGVYTVTQAEYKKVMGENPSWFSADGGGKDKVNGMTRASSRWRR